MADNDDNKCASNAGDEEKNDTGPSLADRMNNALVKPNAFNQIQSDNREILDLVSQNMHVVEQMDCFKRDGARNAKSFALCVESGMMNLVKTRGDMRNIIQLVMEMQKYKPPKSDDKSTRLWSDINASCKNIVKCSVDTMTVSVQYMGFLTRIADAMVYFGTAQQSQANGKKMSIAASMAPLKQDMEEFLVFKQEYDVAVRKARDVALDSINKCMDSFIGVENIKDAQENLKKYEAKYLDDLEALHKLHQALMGQEMELKVKIIPKKAGCDALDLRVKYANGNEQDYRRAMRDAQERAKEYEKKAMNTSDYKEVRSYSRYSHGWHWWWTWGRGGYNTRQQHTGDQTRLRDAARSNRDESAQQETKMIRTQKEKEEAQKRLITIKEELNNLETELRTKQNGNAALLAQKKQVVDHSKKAYDDALKKIEDACAQTGVSENKVVDFLSLTTEILPKSLNMLEGATMINEDMRNFHSFIELRSRTRLSVQDYFKEQQLDRFIAPLKQSAITLMAHLQCDSVDEFKDDIQPALEKARKDGQGDIPNVLMQFVRRICTDPQEIEAWKSDEIAIAQNNAAMLIRDIPPLSEFFFVINKRVKTACDLLKISKPETNKIYLKKAQKLHALNAPPPAAGATVTKKTKIKTVEYLLLRKDDDDDNCLVVDGGDGSELKLSYDEDDDDLVEEITLALDEFETAGAEVKIQVKEHQVHYSTGQIEVKKRKLVGAKTGDE